MPWISWIGEFFILEHTDILEKCNIRCSFLELPWQFSFIIEPSLWACVLPMVSFRSKRNLYIILSRWIENVGNSSLSATLQTYKSKFHPYCTVQTQSNISHFLCYIASSKHGWEPIRVCVTWVLFYKYMCNFQGDFRNKIILALHCTDILSQGIYSASCQVDWKFIITFILKTLPTAQDFCSVMLTTKHKICRMCSMKFDSLYM